MNFVTLHDLSRELNIPARVVRYRFTQLRDAGKLVEGDDFRKDDYVDEQHFIWKINPLSFMREMRDARLQPAIEFPSFTNEHVFDNKAGYQTVNQPVAKSSQVGYQSDNNDTDFGTKYRNQSGYQNEIDSPNHPVAEHPHSNKQNPLESSLEREMIDFMKERIKAVDEQLHAKDSQIIDLSKQNHELNDLNIRLVGQSIKQSEHIQELLQLTSAKPGYQPDSSESAMDTKMDTTEDHLATKPVNSSEEFDNKLDTNLVNKTSNIDTKPEGSSIRFQTNNNLNNEQSLF